jgi:hypothetical protein
MQNLYHSTHPIKNDLSVKQGLFWGKGNQWEEEGQKEKVMGELNKMKVLYMHV